MQSNAKNSDYSKTFSSRLTDIEVFCSEVKEVVRKREENHFVDQFVHTEGCKMHATTALYRLRTLNYGKNY